MAKNTPEKPITPQDKAYVEFDFFLLEGEHVFTDKHGVEIRLQKEGDKYVMKRGFDGTVVSSDALKIINAIAKHV